MSARTRTKRLAGWVAALLFTAAFVWAIALAWTVIAYQEEIEVEVLLPPRVCPCGDNYSGWPTGEYVFRGYRKRWSWLPGGPKRCTILDLERDSRLELEFQPSDRPRVLRSSADFAGIGPYLEGGGTFGDEFLFADPGDGPVQRCFEYLGQITCVHGLIFDRAGADPAAGPRPVEDWDTIN